MSESNRELLVAMLALLTDANPHPDLAAALKAWSQDRQQPLVQLLEQATALDDEHLRALVSLAEAHLQTQRDDRFVRPDALNAGELTQDAATEINDEDLEMTLDSGLSSESTLPLEPGPEGVSGALGSSGASSGSMGERFKLIRPHASGGIGQVWVARDSELQRDVALKEIQPRYAEREDQRARFVLEAEITGNLEHPGVVPVYSLGRNAQGRPYYAMRFIQGESFSVAIKQFHERLREEAGKAETTSRSPSKWGMEFRQLIGRFLDVCDAIDYAHSRGVLHRDLKPPNIMLGHYGETLVVDWGLAKVIGKNEVIRAPAQGEIERGPSDESETVSGGTEQGTTIGTPAYMSPEQAQGLIDQLGPASDVYSLGATLYELLTGRVAFLDKKLSVVLQKVLVGDFPPPRALDRSIPAPLEAICLKAMATEPAARYPSVRTLAQDIEHWLADEPVAAYPEQRLERLGRWIRHHRTWTYAVAAALVGVSTVATIAAVVIEGARRSEAAVRKEAETNFDMAQQAVEDYLTNISENTLLREQDTLDIRSLRHTLLRSALEYYRRFAEQRRNDPLLRGQLAKAYFRVGQITREIDSDEKAIAAFHSAQTIWKPLAAANPDDHELEWYLAECDLAIGRLQSTSGKLSGAMSSLTDARIILDRLAVKHPHEPRYEASLADCYSEIATVHAKNKETDDSLALLEKAKSIQKGLIEQHPETLDYQKSLTETMNVIGFAHFQKPDIPAALQSFQEVEAQCQTILKSVTDGPKPVWLLNQLALSQYNIACAHKENGNLEKALESFDQSIGTRKTLVEAHPSVTHLKYKLGMSYREIAMVEHEAHQEPKALQSIGRSIDLYKDLVRLHPEESRYHSQLGLSWNYMGVLYDNAGKNHEAIEPLKQAVSEQQLAVDMLKNEDVYKERLYNHLDNLGEQYVKLGNVAQGFPHYRHALRIRRQLSTAHLQNGEHNLEVVKALIAMGNLRRHDGDPVAAGQQFSEARTLIDRWLVAEPTDSGMQGQVAAALDGEANALADQAKFSDARPLLERAVKLLRPGAIQASSDPTATVGREAYSEALWDLARLLEALKSPVEAHQAEVERIDLWKDRPPGELVALALKHAIGATLIGPGKTELSAGAKAVRKLELDQAANELRLAIEHGFKDLAMLRSNPKLAILLARDDLKSLIKDLESPDQLPGSRTP